MQNTTSDLIIRIKNGYMAKKEEVDIPDSKLNLAILEKLKSLTFIGNIKKKEKSFKVRLIYNEKIPVLTGVEIYSKPGRRYYISYKDLKPVLGGLGYSLISTPKGILTNREARSKKVGGELLFAVW